MRRPRPVHRRTTALVAVTAISVVMAVRSDLPPVVGTGPLTPETRALVEEVLSDPLYLDEGSIPALGRVRDLRVAWILVDLARFNQIGPTAEEINGALADLTDTPHGTGRDDVPWVDSSELLLELDVPAPPGYLELKAAAHTAVEPDWAPFFDPAATLDWRLVSWGGVPIDGISVLVDPPMVLPAEGRWIDDDELVIGIEVTGDARAYPVRVLNGHEMVHDQVGGSRVAITYCTLCLTAATYLVDDLAAFDAPLDLRTSGLLHRSNKLMYDTATWSLWDQFTGTAVTGPLRGTRLSAVMTGTTTWGEWRRAHPEGRVVAEGAGTGRDYDPAFLGDRDVDGPIFPVGAIDSRLPAQQVVIGVESRGDVVAFPAEAAREAALAGRVVREGPVELRLVDGALLALVDGRPVPGARRSYWFAWSQRHSATGVWDGS